MMQNLSFGCSKKENQQNLNNKNKNIFYQNNSNFIVSSHISQSAKITDKKNLWKSLLNDMVKYYVDKNTKIQLQEETKTEKVNSEQKELKNLGNSSACRKAYYERSLSVQSIRKRISSQKTYDIPVNINESQVKDRYSSNQILEENDSCKENTKCSNENLQPKFLIKHQPKCPSQSLDKQKKDSNDSNKPQIWHSENNESNSMQYPKVAAPFQKNTNLNLRQRNSLNTIRKLTQYSQTNLKDEDLKNERFTKKRSLINKCFIGENKNKNLEEEQQTENLQEEQSTNNSNEQENTLNLSNQKSDEIELPNRIDQSQVEQMKIQLELYKKFTPYFERSKIIYHFEQSLSYIYQFSENEQNYIEALQKQRLRNNLNIEKICQNHQQEVIQFEQKIESQNKEINKLLEYQNLYNQSLLKIQNQQEKISKQESTIQAYQLQIQESEKSFEQQNSLNKELIQQNEQKFQEQQNTLLTQINDQNIQIDQLNKDLSQYQSLYQESSNNNEQLKSNILEKEKKIKEQIEQNAQLERDLENIKQQLTQNQQETVKKLFQELTVDQNQAQNIDQQVQQVLVQLNPKTEINTNMVQFTKAHQIINQNQPSEQEKFNLKQKNDQIVQQFYQNLQNIQNPKQESMQCLLALQNMYKQDGVQTFITDQQIQNLEKDQNYLIQQSYLQIGFHNQAAYFSLQIDKNSSLYENLMSIKTKQHLDEFLSKFKEMIGKMINSQTPQQDITIVSISFDQQPQIDFKIASQSLTRQEIKKKLTFQDLGLSLSEKSLLESAKLTVDMFNPQFNMEWGDNYKGRKEVRGQLQIYNQKEPVDHNYHFPVGYKGFALNIDRYGQDKLWISQNADSKTWIVLFHGTKEKAIEGIMKDNLAPGMNNAYGGYICRITNTKIKEGKNANVYLTDDLTVAEKYATATSTHNGKQFHIIFQCRVNPKGVKSPVHQTNYYTVEDNFNIRPYRILLKEYQQKSA
ncbi:hypothetical protein TTHERM_00394640 (macronuclear) [Tetrahymena thermophila SB210]|uniref:PARP catalytic domain-containing protein n=1 Tax=Tetrahymena thermophila (strain SB210) TaxID=312017 RepID=Q232Y9_TETTS|nr:hypothetical protein TTHERM_00394640 [Tetrahymena thermophila SB210]EAR91691.1 hypothetical protein TTHERM_00394640 [Tetrahymena thermophila SB210]|eukprot:XP_001011936.1 hypothetical protein TTHERM_00394640 [Tetrahymena thermophila SB210]